MSEKIKNFKEVKGKIGQVFVFTAKVEKWVSENNPDTAFIMKPFVGEAPYQRLRIYHSEVDNNILEVEDKKIYQFRCIQEPDYIRPDGTSKQIFRTDIIREVTETLTLAELMTMQIVNVLPVKANVAVEEPLLDKK